GSRAGALLSVTPEWKSAPETLSLRYEDLIQDCSARLEQLIEELGWPIRTTVAQAVAETSIPKLRAATNNDNHFWIGRPGLWRKFLPAPRALRMAAAHMETFRILDYICDADPLLDDRAADANWIETVWAGLAEAWQSMLDQKKELQAARAELVALREHSNFRLGYSIAVAPKRTPSLQSQEGTEISIPTSTIVPLPPRELRTRATGISSAQWFQKSGRLSMASLENAIASLGMKWSDFGRILDFGAGCGRLL